MKRKCNDCSRPAVKDRVLCSGYAKKHQVYSKILYRKMKRIQLKHGLCHVPGCRWMPKRGHALCEIHQQIGRDCWRKHAKICKATGTCINCHKKARPGQQRCLKHIKLNRQKCHAWMMIHQHERWEKRKALTLKTGLCQGCRDHNPVIKGTFRCNPCAKRLHKLKRSAL